MKSSSHQAPNPQSDDGSRQNKPVDTPNAYRLYIHGDKSRKNRVQRLPRYTQKATEKLTRPLALPESGDYEKDRRGHSMYPYLVQPVRPTSEVQFLP